VVQDGGIDGGAGSALAESTGIPGSWWHVAAPDGSFVLVAAAVAALLLAPLAAGLVRRVFVGGRRRAEPGDPDTGGVAFAFSALAIAVCLLAALDPERTEAEVVAVPVDVLAVGAPPTAAQTAVFAAPGPDGDGAIEARIVDGAGARALGERRAAVELARALAGPRELTLLWTAGADLGVGDDRSGGVRVVGADPARRVRAVLASPGLPFEPATAVDLRLLRPARVDRPTAFEWTARLPDEVREAAVEASIVVDTTDGERLFEVALDRAALDGEAEQIAWRPDRAGDVRLSVELRWTDGDAVRVVRSTATLAVASEAEGALHRVDVVDDGSGAADVVVAALREQAVAARAVEESGLRDALLGGAEARPGTIVLLVDVADDLQEAIERLVDDGGGLFVVGGVDGGGVPSRDSPLHPLLPLACSPPRPEAGDGTGDGTGVGADERDAAPESAAVDEPRADPPPPDPSPP
jgi:hypothetical protein